ncbi:MAG: hypothetical protein R3F20_11040 [Planctomycetota bacterium]
MSAALGIDLAFDGHDLLAPGGLDCSPANGTSRALVAGPRVIDYASPRDRVAPTASRSPTRPS